MDLICFQFLNEERGRVEWESSFFLLSKAGSVGKSYSLAQTDHSKRIVQIFCLKMVGKDGHHVIGAKHAEGINQQAAHRLFNLMNCLLLAEKKPATLAMLEEAYLEMEGASVPHHKFGFPSGLHLVAAWFDRAWFRCRSCFEECCFCHLFQILMIVIVCCLFQFLTIPGARL